jgi:Uma2 family endonuclease
MPDTVPTRMTVEQFLAWDDGTDCRYELVDGVPVAMVPPRGNHQVLAGTMAGHLFMALRERPPCTVRVEAGIRSRLSANTWFQADLAVTCSQAASNDPEVPEPILIVEILSPSTGSRDRRRKLPEYRAIPSVREIVLVDQEQISCEVHRRLDAGRWLTDLLREPGDRLRLDTVALDLPLTDLYARVPTELE